MHNHCGFRWFLFGVGILFILPILFLPGQGAGHAGYLNQDNSGANPTSGWRVECVDCPKYFENMTDHSLRLDSNGYPHIVYGGDHLYHAWYDGAILQIETVDTSSNVGQYASLVLDTSGFPHISYYAGYPSRHLKYAYRDAAGWHIQTIYDTDSTVPSSSSLALDTAGWPHISYSDNVTLKYAYQDATGWYTQIVDSNVNGKYLSLALDGAGHPHISYSAYGSDTLKHAYRDAIGDWHPLTVGSVGVSIKGLYSSLALDNAGYPHISYYDPINRDLQYAYQDVTGWYTQTLDSIGSVGEGTSLVLNSDGFSHISYFDTSNSTQKYIYQDESGWHIQSLSPNSGSRAGFIHLSSLALDADGYPHISYIYASSYYKLQYAYQDATGWYTQTLDSSGSVGQHVSLAVDTSGYPHISYYDSDHRDLKYAFKNVAGWHIQTLDSGGTVGEYTSLALDTEGYPHISYFDGTNFELKYIYQDSSGWYTQTIDGGGVDTSLILDANNYPHISYQDGGYQVLKYAYQDDSGWHTQSVDHSGSGRYNSLALDANGYPHISYRYRNTKDLYDDLRYAYEDATGWHIQIIDHSIYGNDEGLCTSLALDASGYPHIIYYEDMKNLKQADQDASGWSIHTRYYSGSSRFREAPFESSLVLDANGYLHLSFYGDTGNYTELLYGNDDPDVPGSVIFTTSVLDKSLFTSLALDSGGNPHIAYFDINNHDLMYTFFDPNFIPTATPTEPVTSTPIPTSSPTSTLTPEPLKQKLYLPGIFSKQ